MVPSLPTIPALLAGELVPIREMRVAARDWCARATAPGGNSAWRPQTRPPYNESVYGMEWNAVRADRVDLCKMPLHIVEVKDIKNITLYFVLLLSTKYYCGGLFPSHRDTMSKTYTSKNSITICCGKNVSTSTAISNDAILCKETILERVLFVT